MRDVAHIAWQVLHVARISAYAVPIVHRALRARDQWRGARLVAMYMFYAPPCGNQG